MIIDCHTHLGTRHIVAGPKELLDSMDLAGIDRSLVFAGHLNGYSNDQMLRDTRMHPDRLSGVACVDLNLLASDDPWTAQDAGVRFEGALADEHVVAAKFYLGYDHFFPNDPVVYRAMSLVRSERKTAIFHCGDCFCKIHRAKLKFAHPLGIDEVAVDFRDTRIVIAHMGWPWHRDAAEVVYKNPNVFADISGFVYGSFDRDALSRFDQVIHEFIDVAGDASKLLFGSDWPISAQASLPAGNLGSLALGSERSRGFNLGYVDAALEIAPLRTVFQNARKAFDLP